MDVDFSSREVWCTPILKRGFSSGKWTTHFLVLEGQQRENGDGEKTAVSVRTFRTGKVTHEDRDLELVKAAERTEIVLV